MHLKKHFITVLLLLLAQLMFSQKDSSGVYLSPDNFLMKKLSYPASCKKQHQKINDDVLFHAKEIKIKFRDSTFELDKNKIYAVKYCGGEIIRIYNYQSYEMLNPAESILIYKIVSESAGMDPVTLTNYYFSKNAQNPPQLLTLKNLKAAFSSNSKFLNLLDQQIKSEADLTAYDSAHKKYKVNWLFSQSK